MLLFATLTKLTVARLNKLADMLHFWFLLNSVIYELNVLCTLITFCLDEDHRLLNIGQITGPAGWLAAVPVVSGETASTGGNLRPLHLLQKCYLNL